MSWRIATKSTYLTCVALLSTPLCIGLLVFIHHHTTILLSIDSMINCWCIMLMINTSKKIYDKLCVRMEHRIITTKCILYYSCNCHKLRVLNEDINNNNNNNSIANEMNNEIEIEIATNTENTIPSNSETGTEE